jgi:ABC-type multidrug transport system fused ATPase/permease subunit
LNEATKKSKKRLQSETVSLDEDRESQEEGTVSLEVYKKYFKAIQSLPLVIFVLVLRVINQAVASFIDYFVAQWVNWEESLASEKQLYGSATNTTEDSAAASTSIDDKRQSFVNYYIMIIVIFVILILNAEFSFFYSLIRASKNLHDYMFRGLTQTYMQFFNQNPSGRILNRFSKDIGSIDTALPTTLFECICVSSRLDSLIHPNINNFVIEFQFVLEILAIMVLVSIVNIYFIIPTIVIGVVLYGARHIYVSASRNIKRVESITRSPIYAHTNATLQGLSTIRAFKAEESVKLNFNTHMDNNTSVSESINHFRMHLKLSVCRLGSCSGP